MTGENPSTPERPVVDPVLELVALHFEKDAMGWLTKPEEYHPLSGAIDNGQMGTREDRVQAVTSDAKEVAGYLMDFAAQIRRGEVTDQALIKLRMSARFDKEAFQLMKALDPEAKPWYPDADANGTPVVVGKKYRYYPGKDNQGNEAGYYCEGIVTEVNCGMATATWGKVGEENPLYWGRAQRKMELDDNDYLRETFFEIEEELFPRETMVPTQTLIPVEED